MKVQVRYTAQLRAVVGRSDEEVELPEGVTLRELLVHLARRSDREAASHLVTEAEQVRPSLLVVVNDAAAPAGVAAATTLQAGDVVTLMPPIAGG